MVVGGGVVGGGEGEVGVGELACTRKMVTVDPPCTLEWGPGRIVATDPGVEQSPFGPVWPT